jgi:hypothetical protein
MPQTPQGTEIEQIVKLMEQTDTDIIEVFEHVILGTTAFNFDDEVILSWIPAESQREVLRWLRYELKGQEEE